GLDAAESYGDGRFLPGRSRIALDTLGDAWFDVFGVLGVIGAPMFARGRDRRRLAAMLAMVGLGLAPIIFFGDTRFKLPLFPFVPTDTLRAVAPYSQVDHRPPHNRLLSDAAFQFFPWVSVIDAELHHGRLPQWNPDLLGGVRVTPNAFVGAYYPPTWLGRWLG